MMRGPIEIDTDALRRKYAQERAKRLRPDGNDQYIQLKGEFGDLLRDPYVAPADREPRRDHVTFTFVGGGFAGLVTGARLKEIGIPDVRIVEKAGGFGGTWYWNRYPGAMCDTSAMIYLPLLEETGYMPSERYAHAPEIRAHCDRIAAHYGLHEGALFHTEVTDLEWDERRYAWIVRTDRGDEFTSTFVAIGTGPLHVAKLPGITGIGTFGGHSFHTSRWDYAYTGGSPEGAPMDPLADKRVAIIGTGATAVQCVPHLAATAGELFCDGWTDLVKRIRGRISAPRSAPASLDELLADFEIADFEKMSEIRARVDAVVADWKHGREAEGLVPPALQAAVLP